MPDGPGVDGHHTMRAHRDDLLAAIERWRVELDSVGPGPTTLWPGVGHGAVAKVSTMIELAAAEFVPASERPERPTVGQLVGLLERAAGTATASCIGRPGRLIRPSEMRVLNRLTRLRASIAHVEETAAALDPISVGRLGGEEVAGFLDAAAEFCGLPLVEEVICREAVRTAEGD